MRYKLKPDEDIAVQRIQIGRVPTLILQSKDKEPAGVGLLWIHGGGYFLGMKEMVYMGRGMEFAQRHGVTVFSPGYRLAWQKPFPAAFEDCFEVLRYMDANRTALGFDRIMVGGESAGGGLAAAVCMAARDRGIRVAFQMPLYPMLSNIDTESSRNNHGKVWNTRRNHIGWGLYLRGGAKKAVSPYAAPAAQTDYRNLPPCCTFVGDGEPFYIETLKFVEDLRAAGVEAEADVYHTDVHAFDLIRPNEELSKRAIEKVHDRFAFALEHYW